MPEPRTYPYVPNLPAIGAALGGNVFAKLPDNALRRFIAEVESKPPARLGQAPGLDTGSALFEARAEALKRGLSVAQAPREMPTGSRLKSFLTPVAQATSTLQTSVPKTAAARPVRPRRGGRAVASAPTLESIRARLAAPPLAAIPQRKPSAPPRPRSLAIRPLNPGEFVANPDGSRSTERTITVNEFGLNGGRATNIPTIWNVDGQIVELSQEQQDQAVRYAIQSGLQYPNFESIDKAVAAAQKRSDRGGAFQGPIAKQRGAPTLDNLKSRLGMPVPEMGRLRSAGGAAVQGAAAIPALTIQAPAINRGMALRALNKALDAVDRGEKPRNLGEFPPHIQAEIGVYRGAAPEARQAIRQRFPQEDPRDSLLFEAGEAMTAATRKAFPTDPAYQDEFAQKFVGGLGSTFGFLATGILTGGAAGPLVIGAATGEAMQFKDALEAGASIEDAYKAAQMGKYFGATEAMPLARLMTRFNKATRGSLKKALLEGLKGGTEEGLQEFVQSIGQNVIASDLVGYDPERDLTHGTIMDTGVGFSVGTLFNVIASMLGGRRRAAPRVAQPRVEPTIEPAFTPEPAREPFVSPTIKEETPSGPVQGPIRPPVQGPVLPPMQGPTRPPLQGPPAPPPVATAPPVKITPSAQAPRVEGVAEFELRELQDEARRFIAEKDWDAFRGLISEVNSNGDIEVLRRTLDEAGYNPDRYLPRTEFSPEQNETLSVEEMEGAIEPEPAPAVPVAAVQDLLPAIRTTHQDGRVEVFTGEPGQLHGDVANQVVDSVFAAAKENDLGFVDARTGEYLTRQEAFQKATEFGIKVPADPNRAAWGMDPRTDPGQALDALAIREALPEQARPTVARALSPSSSAYPRETPTVESLKARVEAPTALAPPTVESLKARVEAEPAAPTSFTRAEVPEWAEVVNLLPKDPKIPGMAADIDSVFKVFEAVSPGKTNWNALTDAEKVEVYNRVREQAGRPREAFDIPKAAPAPAAKPAAAAGPSLDWRAEVKDERATERLRKGADALQKQIDAKRNSGVSQQNYTPRRGRIAEGMRADADRLEEIQTQMRGLADLRERGEAPDILARITSKAQIESLRWRSYPGESFDKGASARLKKAGITKRNFAKAKEALEGLSSGLAEKQQTERYAGSLKQRIQEVEFGRGVKDFFQTPEVIAGQMVELAEIEPGMEVLEPSAGAGAIANKIRDMAPNANLTVIEQAPSLVEILREQGFKVREGNFLEMDGAYDRVIMNPPFSKGQDVVHVRNAYAMLTPGGRVVAIMGPHGFFASDKKSTAFRDWFVERGGEKVIDLPSDTFEQTGASAQLVVINKPGKSQRAPTPAVPVEPTYEPTAQGQQAVMPGAERITEAQQAQRGAEAPLKAKRAQEAPTEGLFDVAGRGQMDLVDLARKPAPAKKAPKRPKAPSKRPPTDLIEYLANGGGVVDQTGELKAMDADKAHLRKYGGKPFQKRLVRADGVTPDYAREDAEEAGYLKPGSTIADLYEAIGENLGGRPVYSEQDFDSVQEYEAQAQLDDPDVRDHAEYMAEVEEMFMHSGIAWPYSKKAWETISRPFQRFAPLGKLPKTKQYLLERYLTLGRLDAIEREAREVGLTFRKASKFDKAKVYEYLTNSEASPEIVPPAVRTAAMKAKDAIDKLGQKLVAAGLISEESFEANRGQYLPRVYLKYLLPEGATVGGGGRPRPSNLAYTKARKDIPKEIRELVLGEVKDPAYLAAKAIAIPGRDLEILDFLGKISQNAEWTFPETMVEWRGKKVTAYWLKSEATRVRNDVVPRLSTEQRDEALAIADEMDAIADPPIEELGGKVPADYKQIPDTMRYGMLRGMWVRKEIHDDIMGAAGMGVDPDGSTAEKLLGYGGGLTKLTQLWKLSKVALNPPTQVRNFVSNGILLHLSGVPFHRVYGPNNIVVKAIFDIRRDGKYWKIAKKYGVSKSTFAATELHGLQREVIRLESEKHGPFALMKRLGHAVAKTAGDVYGMSEAIFKTAKIMDAMKREGMSEGDAALAAQEALFDYSLVPRSVGYLRNAPVGIPFITFYYKAFPRIIEAAVKNPGAFAPYIALPYIMAAMIAAEYDVEQDDVEKLKKALPKWLQKRGNAWLLPYKDKYGRWQAVDMGYYLPWSMYSEVVNAAGRGEPIEALKSAGATSSPLLQITSAAMTGIDPFTEREIANSADPPAKQVADIMKFIWRLAMPSWVTDQGAAVKIYDAIQNKTDYRGDPSYTVWQAIPRAVGLNVYPIEPTKSRQRNIRRMSREIDDIRSRMRSVMRDQRLSEDQRNRERKRYQTTIKRAQESRLKYMEESQIHPRLQ